MLDFDIVIDEEAFSQAATDMQELAGRLQKLKNDTEEMMNELKHGWNTDAGRKFISACEACLYQPLEDQKLVIDHISETLADARSAYASVFAEYAELQNTIKKAM